MRKERKKEGRKTARLHNMASQYHLHSAEFGCKKAKRLEWGGAKTQVFRKNLHNHRIQW